jgi:hypothetical protein
VRYRVLGFEESGVRIQESGFRIQESGFGIRDSGVKILVYLIRLGNAILSSTYI